ncbi:MAG TPA: energy transducer TonB [Gemmatimonadales bacterium]|nr:energy transducer TonB [Gemmatimonadales bacterium]
MQLTLLESHRSVFQVTECALVSVLAHAGVVWLAVSATAGGTTLPNDEREARVFFLLPPDRVDVRSHQMDRFQWGLLGQDLENGRLQVGPGESRPFETPARGLRGPRHRAGSRGQLPFGPVPQFVPDSVFSVLQVDQIVERYANSAAPIYPPDLLKIGAQGQVEATYVVDTTGMVDTTTVQIEQSDDPRFTASVRDALGLMRFRPAKRGGQKVRQLVEQTFRFHIVPPSQMAKQVSRTSHPERSEGGMTKRMPPSLRSG